MDKPLLTTVQAAAQLAISPRTLEDWRLKGGGPSLVKLGVRCVRYRPEDLDKFVDKAACQNTGEALQLSQPD